MFQFILSWWNASCMSSIIHRTEFEKPDDHNTTKRYHRFWQIIRNCQETEAFVPAQNDTENAEVRCIFYLALFCLLLLAVSFKTADSRKTYWSSKINNHKSTYSQGWWRRKWSSKNIEGKSLNYFLNIDILISAS
jgi:hypothetical protein